ncbi:MAG TPA: hypothetical protein VHB97_11200 [Polyangia bacterium]|nr:hypothetical protein [Polyangia bacterium]
MVIKRLRQLEVPTAPQTHDEFSAPLAYAPENELRAEVEDMPLGGCDFEHCLRMRE